MNILAPSSASVPTVAPANAKSTLHATLSALEEVIKSKQNQESPHDPTPTEYFALIVTILPSSYGSKSDSNGLKFHELLKILIAVTPNASTVIVRRQFKMLAQILLQLIKVKSQELEQEENALLLRTSLVALGTLLMGQETSDGFWTGMVPLQSLNAFLTYLDHSHNSIRKAAHEQLNLLMQSHRKQQALPVRSYISEFCTQVMRACTRNSYTRSLYVVLFLEHVAVNLPQKGISKVMEVALRLQSCDIPKLSAAVYRLFDALFQHPMFAFDAETTQACVLLLLKHAPRTEDMESNTYFCTALASGAIALRRVEQQQNHQQQQLGNGMVAPASVSTVSRSYSMLLKVSRTLTLVLDGSEFTQIQCAVGTALKRLIYSFVDRHLMPTHGSTAGGAAGSIPREDGAGSTLKGFLFIMQSLLQLKYQSSWVYILDNFRALFDIVRGLRVTPSAAETGVDAHRTLIAPLRPLVVNLADLNEAMELQSLSLQPEVEVSLRDTLGSALRLFGVSAFLSVVPIQIVHREKNEFGEISPEITHEMLTKSTSKDWLINVLHINLRNIPCRISDFGACILSVAGNYNKLLKKVKGKRSLTESQEKIIRNKIIQLWSLFPDFCAFGVIDLPDSFPKMVKTLKFCFGESVRADDASASSSPCNPSFPEILPGIVHGLDLLVAAVKNRGEPLIAEQEPLDSEPLTIADQQQQQGRGLVGSPDLRVLKAHTTEIVPMLLKYVEGLKGGVSDSHFQAGVQCVSSWMSISPPALVATVSKKLLHLLLSTTAGGMGANQVVFAENGEQESAVAAGWMAVMASIIPHMSHPLVQLLYKTVRPLLSVDDSHTLQKRAYNVLNHLLSVHSECVHRTCEPRVAILAVIRESLLTCHVSSRNMRLRCIDTLMQGMTDEEVQLSCEMVLGEVLICQKDANKKTRDGATAILRHFFAKLDCEALFAQLCSALVGETTTLMRSSAITGICLLLLEHRHSPEMHRLALELLPSLRVMLEAQSPEQTKAVLSYVRICAAVFPLHMLLPSAHNRALGKHPLALNGEGDCGDDSAVGDEMEVSTAKGRAENALQLIVASFTEKGLGQQKSKFASRCRAIMRKLFQRVGESTLRAVVPSTDVALLDYVARQARKADRKRAATASASAGGKRSQFDRLMGSDSEDGNSDDDDDHDNEYDLHATNSGVNGATGKKLSKLGLTASAGDLEGPKRKRDRSDSDVNDASGDHLTAGVQKMAVLVGETQQKFRLSSSSAPTTRLTALGSKRGRLLGGTSGNEASAVADTDDYRLGARPMAIRVRDALESQRTSARRLPGTLEELMQDEDGNAGAAAAGGGGRGNRKGGVSGKKGLGGAGGGDDGELYNVVVTKDGRVVISEREAADTMSLKSIGRPRSARAGTGAQAMGGAGVGAEGGEGAEVKDAGRFGRADGTSGGGKRRRLTLREPGEEYRSRKGAGGDVWKKGMLEPHAFIPLDPRLLHKKNHQQAVEHFGVVVKTKSGGKGSSSGAGGARSGTGLKRKANGGSSNRSGHGRGRRR